MTEPFGYFKAEPFGWTDCAETDEGAVALYERHKEWVGLTHDEYYAICDKHSAMSDFDFLADIEAKPREKNK